MVILVQALDVSFGLGVELASHGLELFCAAVAAKVALGEKLNKVVVAVAGDAARVAYARLLGRVAGQTGVHGLSNVT